MNSTRSGNYFILGFISILLFFITAIIALIFIPGNLLPAPKLSSSLSFNEKARWLKENLPIKCDVVVIGSSIALNNINTKLIEKNDQLCAVNASSWGLKIDEISKLFESIVDRSHPQKVIYLYSFGDFVANNNDKRIDWTAFRNYISYESNPISPYFTNGDLNYYPTAIIELMAYSINGKRGYQSLDFGDSGSALLDCEGFKKSDSRWNNFEYIYIDHKEIQTAIELIQNMARYGKNKNSNFELVLVGSPVRNLFQERANAHYSQLINALKISSYANNFKLIDPQDRILITDAGFVDTLHLNKCGANILTEYVGKMKVNGY